MWNEGGGLHIGFRDSACKSSSSREFNSLAHDALQYERN